MDTYKKKYADRLIALLATKPDDFRRMAMLWADSDVTGFKQSWQLRDYIQAHYDLINFDLFDHVPDLLNKKYFDSVLIGTYELIGDRRGVVSDIAFSWIKLPFINSVEISKRLGLSESSFLKKLSKEYTHSFTEEEIVKLAQIRQQFIDELRPGIL